MRCLCWTLCLCLCCCLCRCWLRFVGRRASTIPEGLWGARGACIRRQGKGCNVLGEGTTSELTILDVHPHSHDSLFTLHKGNSIP